MSDFTYYVNNIWGIGLVRFVVFLALAFVAATVAGKLAAKLLKLAKLDEKFDKWGLNEGSAGTSAKFIEQLVYLIVFLCFVPSALSAIGINSVADAVSSFVYAFIGYIPNIIAAVVLVYVGVLIAKVLGQIVSALLKKTKLDAQVQKVLPQLKTPASAVVVTAIRVVIIFFAVAQGIQALSLSFLSMVVSDIMYYVPILVKAAAILLAAVIGANLAETAVCKICSKAAKITKIAIYVVAGFMTVSQLGISTKIVETTFVYVVGALAVAFALAFGLGGKDYAKKILDKLDKEEK